MNAIFVHNKRVGRPVRVRQSTHTALCYSCSDQPVFNTTMHENRRKSWQDNEFERQYWRKIFNSIKELSPKPKPGPTPVGQYVLHLIEMVKTEG